MKNPTSKRARARSLLAGAIALGSVGCGAEMDAESHRSGELARTVGDGEIPKIISGSIPARGSLATRGVVRLSSGCTGTLLTNQHVLTARHCVRQWLTTPTGRWGNPSPIPSVLLEGETVREDQSIAGKRVFEPTTTGLNAGDYAVLELSAPATIEDTDNNFFNPIYSDSDRSLVGETVVCAGYGYGREAVAPAPGVPGTLAGGLGILRTASMTVSAARSNTLQINRKGGQVGAGGDSGSTCFFDNQITGVQSTCRASGSVDLNGDGVISNNEWTLTDLCTQASPNAHRTWVNSQILADARIAYTFSPKVAGTVQGVMSTPNGAVDFVAGKEVALDATALRSGWLEARVTEPPNTMCTELQTISPLSGQVELHGACLNEGLLPILL